MNKVLCKILIVFFVTISGSVFAQSVEPGSSKIEVETFQILNLDTNRFNVFPQRTNKTKVGLVLSGGGARGVSQIGVLKVLEKYGLEPDIIVGTSIGSVIGGFYSSGYSANDLDSIFKITDWDETLELSDKSRRRDLFLDQKRIHDKSLLTLSLNGFNPVIPSSLSNGQQITDLINKYIINSIYKPKNSFSDLRYDFSSVATNFDNGEKVVLSKGNLTEAIKASITFPLIYTPTYFNGMRLVDGGLTANIPVDVAFEKGADLVIAVNTTSPLREANELYDPLKTADQIISISMEKLNEIQLSIADFVITPKINNHSSTNFNNLDFLITQGEYETENQIAEIINKVNLSEELKSNYYNDFITNPEIEIKTGYLNDDVKNEIDNLVGERFLRFTEIERVLKYAYSSGDYKKVFAEVSRSNEGALVKFTMEEMPKMSLLKVNTFYPHHDSLIFNFENQFRGKILNRNSCFGLYNDLLRTLRDKDLSIVEINRFYFNYSTGNLEIEFSSGVPEVIQINGNPSTKSNLIKRELLFKTDKRLLSSDVVNSLKNLYSTNLFQQVTISPKFYSDEVTVEVNVVEKSAANLRFALRSDNERNLQLFLDIRDENIFNSGQELGVSASGGLKTREYNISLRSNRFFNTLLTYNFSGYYKFQNINDFMETIDTEMKELIVDKIFTFRDIRTGVSFLLGSQLERFGMIYGKLTYEDAKTKTIEGTGKTIPDLSLTKLKVGGIVDSRDRLPFPNTGTEIDFYYETAQSDIGGNLSFSKFSISIEQYFSIDGRNTFKPKFRYGFADNTTPFIEQFPLGGQYSFYGMVENQLRGRQLLETSLEYRYLLPVKLFFDTYLSARYDLGNAWESAKDIRFKDLRHGFGFSMSFDTPIGEANFAVGRTFLIRRGLTNDSFIWGPYTFYYSLGYDI